MAINFSLQNLQPELRKVLKGVYYISRFLNDTTNSPIGIMETFYTHSGITSAKLSSTLNSIKFGDKESKKWLDITKTMLIELSQGNNQYYLDYATSLNDIKYELIKSKRLRQLFRELIFLYSYKNYNNPFNNNFQYELDTNNNTLIVNGVIKWTDSYNNLYNKATKTYETFFAYDNQHYIQLNHNAVLDFFSVVPVREETRVSFRLSNYNIGKFVEVLAEYKNNTFSIFSHTRS